MNVKVRKKHAGAVICLAGLLLVLLFAVSSNAHKDESSRMGTVLREYVSGQIERHLLNSYVPVFTFVEEENTGKGQLLVDRQMDQIMPLYQYWNADVKDATRVEDRMTIEMILMAEAEEGSSTAQDSGIQEDSAATDNGENPQEAFPGSEDDSQAPLSELEELLKAENEAAGGMVSVTQDEAGQISDFIPHQKLAQVDLNQYLDYENLVQNFYTIDKTTLIGSDQLNIDSLTGKDLTISKDSQGPQILIYHTHSQEAFADSVQGDASTSIVGVGDYLTRILTEKYGYQVLHHTGQYDVESRDDAYSAALPAIEQVLADNPSIQVVIDLHRDAMAEETHLVMDLDGRPTARFMFFNGLSRTRKTGNISYLYNENQDSNLAFSFQMQLKAVQYYPGLTRKIYLKGYRYNMHLRPRTLLIELGAQNNTVEEAMNACDPLAHILDMVLSGGE